MTIETEIVTVANKDYLVKDIASDGSLSLQPVNRIDDMRSELKDYTSQELIEAAVKAAKAEGDARKFADIVDGPEQNFVTGELINNE